MPVQAPPAKIASDLPLAERIMLFCVASGANWEQAGVTHATAQQLLVRGLIDRNRSGGRFKLTLLGRDVVAALLTLPAD